MLADKKGGAQVKRHHRIEIFLVHLKKRLVAGQPGTVHQNVGRGQRRQHTRHLLSVGNIQFQRVKCETVFRCQTCGMRQRLAAPGGDPYLCSRLCEGDGGGEANPLDPPVTSARLPCRVKEGVCKSVMAYTFSLTGAGVA